MTLNGQSNIRKGGALEQAVSALKATIETYFRVRVDQPPPEHHDEAA